MRWGILGGDIGVETKAGDGAIPSLGKVEEGV
jgi:hypothetical protein